MLVLVKAPETEPLSLADAKLHLRLDGTAEDDLITGYIKAARVMVENELRRPLITQTWRLELDGFSPCILLPKPPLQKINSFRYIDWGGTEQDLPESLYQLVSGGDAPARVVPAYLQSWPVTLDVPSCVKIEFDCGYGTADKIPDNIIAALKLIVGDLYANREASVEKPLTELPLGVDRLLAFDRNLIA